MGERYGTVYLFTGDNYGNLHNEGELQGVNVNKNSAPVVTDWNNDGLWDLLVGEESTNSAAAPIHVYVNTGTKLNPSFIRQTVLLTANVEWIYHFRGHPQLTDLDGDDIVDLIVGDDDGHVYFHKNIGSNINPSYLQEVKTGIKRPQKSKPFITDWNEDGILDMVVGDDGLNVHLYLGKNETVANKLKIESERLNNIKINLLKNSVITIKFNRTYKNFGTLQLFKLNGVKVLNHNFRSFADEYNYDLPILSKGIYIVNLLINEEHFNKRLIVR